MPFVTIFLLANLFYGHILATYILDRTLILHKGTPYSTYCVTNIKLCTIFRGWPFKAMPEQLSAMSVS